MLKEMSELAPRAALLAGIAWACANYFLIAPSLATRIVDADYLPACEAGFRARVIDSAQQRIAALPKPSIDPVKEMTADHLRAFRKSPIMEDINRSGLGALFGLDLALDLADGQIEAQKLAAADSYRRAIAQIEAVTATELGAAGTICGAVADAAIADTLMQWAVFSGTIGLVRVAPLPAFAEKMAQVQASGRFAATTEVAR